MDKIQVKGGRRLEGDVRISGAKNAALPILASALLVDGRCVFHNVPKLKDIDSILLLLEDLGCKTDRDGHTVTVDASGLDRHEAAYDLVRKMRASILVLGPLTARLGRARVSLPGGCAIGARPVNLHQDGLMAMGADIGLDHGYVEAACSRLQGADFTLDLPSVGATENLMMAAALADGETVLRNVAQEPEIQALGDVLRKMGAEVEGDGTDTIRIVGRNALSPVEVAIIPDRIEAGTFMVAAAITGGDVRLTHCCPDHMEAIIEKIRETGADVTSGSDWIRVRAERALNSVDIVTEPYPGFPTDMQAQFMALMCVASGECRIMETIFESRFSHVNELQRMGADLCIEPCNNVVTVRGVGNMSGAPVMASDLRASASLILAGLVAENTTTVNRVYHLDRGYESIEAKFEKIGARITRVSEA